MKNVDLIRVAAIMLAGYVAAFFASLAVGRSLIPHGMFDTAVLITILWAVREGQEPKA